MPAGTYDKFIIEQGATFDNTITWQDQNGDPIDNSGYTARMKVRADDDEGTEIIELTTENSRIVLGGSNGEIQLIISASDTAGLTEFETGVYDLELVNGSTVTRLIQGKIRFDKNVTA